MVDNTNFISAALKNPTMANTVDISLDQLINERTMESVSKVAIRNLNPAHIDTNDPDQRKLVEHLKRLQANIWEYSDNQPSFLASLNRNDPSRQRRVIESIMVKSVAFEDPIMSPTETMSAGGEPGTIIPGTTGSPNNAPTTSNQTSHRRMKGTIRFSSKTTAHEEFKRQQLELQQTQAPSIPTTDPTSGTSPVSYQYSQDSTVDHIPQPEMKMIIRKTLELIVDMSKSVELVYHAIRASARFLTYPTPSLPSDNHICGHVRGWIWLVYKSLVNFEPTDTDQIQIINKEMNKLSAQAKELHKTFKRFSSGLKGLYESVKREAKLLKYQNHLWALRIEAFLKFSEDLKLKKNLLVDVREDKSFPSDWVFEPNPSLTSQTGSKNVRDFFHFQWVKTKDGWDKDGFEVRSDYSTQWHRFSEFNSDLQVEMIVFLIQHLTAVLDECCNFVSINMRLSFDFDEIKCLKFAVAEILSVKKNTGTVEYIADLTKRLFQDMALLEEISEEFAVQLSWISSVTEPCYKSLGSKKAIQLSETNTKNNNFPHGIPLPPLQHPSTAESLGERSIGDSLLSKATQVKGRFRICPCIGKSQKDFLEVYGEPMEAVFLRTPITKDIVLRFFPKESLIPSEIEFHMLSSARINAYGLSDAYRASLFDQVLGRDPPVKKVKKLPKFRRHIDLPHGKEKEPKFELNTLLQYSRDVIRKPTDCEIDTENYLKLFDQIKKFLQAFGTLFNFILSELTEKLENLDNKLYTGLTDHYESLEKIIDHETTAGIIEDEPWFCGTRAFRRINIALIFFTSFMNEVVKLGDADGTAYPCKTCYYKTYARYHSWFNQKSAAFSIYSLPSKKLLYNKVCPNVDAAEVDKLFEEFVQNGIEIYEQCENTFRAYQLSDL